MSKPETEGAQRWADYTFFRAVVTHLESCREPNPALLAEARERLAAARAEYAQPTAHAEEAGRRRT